HEVLLHMIVKDKSEAERRKRGRMRLLSSVADLSFYFTVVGLFTACYLIPTLTVPVGYLTIAIIGLTSLVTFMVSQFFKADLVSYEQLGQPFPRKVVEV